MRVVWESPDPEVASARLRAVLGTDLVPTAPRSYGGRDDRLHVSDEPADAPADRPAVVIGFATVDAERAAADRDWILRPLPPDLVLGAFAWSVEEQPEIVVLEPNTEARIAASLARHGEGPAAIYVAAGGSDLEAARAAAVGRGATVTPIARGPFGPAFALAGGPIWGPFLVVVGTGTIRG